MSGRAGLAVLLVSALVDLLLVWLWGSPAVTAAVFIVLARLVVPAIGVILRQRWVLYLGALLALACTAAFWIIVFLTPAVPIACLVVARRLGTTPRDAGRTAALDHGKPST